MEQHSQTYLWFWLEMLPRTSDSQIILTVTHINRAKIIKKKTSMAYFTYPFPIAIEEKKNQWNCTLSLTRLTQET